MTLPNRRIPWSSTRTSKPRQTCLFDKKYLRDISDNILDDENRVKLAQSDEFPTSESTVVTYADGVAFAGSFDGVPGTFKCVDTGELCDIGTNDKGDLVKQADWRFTPLNSMATIKNPDAEYTYFGWWLNKPKNNDAEHDVEVFAGGTTGHEAVVTSTIEGTASYSGSAAGKYATKTSVAGTQTDAAVGHFTADASLTARFGDGIAMGTIEGAVRNFELDDGTSPAWSVTLESGDDLTNAATFDGTTEVNFGGGSTATVEGAGKWQGSFFDDGEETADPPGTVAGTFDAVTPSASVIGGFGATLQP